MRRWAAGLFALAAAGAVVARLESAGPDGSGALGAAASTFAAAAALVVWLTGVSIRPGTL